MISNILKKIVQAGDLILTLADKLRELKRNGATDEELNAYTEAVFSKSRYDLTDYVSGLLNSQEKALFNSNKAKGTLCIANGKFAVDYAQKNYISSELHNGNGDAFRHTLWCYGMVVDVGYDFAKKWSDAHENGAVGQPSIEKQMDLHNNAVGLNLGKTYPNTILHSTFIKNTKFKVDTGCCRRIKSGKITWTSGYGKK